MNLIPPGACLLVIVLGFILIWAGRGAGDEAQISVWGISMKKLSAGVALVTIGLIGIGVWYKWWHATDATAKLDLATRGQVTEISGVPPFPDLKGKTGEDRQHALGQEWLSPLYDAQISIGFDRTTGIERGDYAAVFPDVELPDEGLENDELGALADASTVTLQVTSKLDQTVYASLSGIEIDAFIHSLPKQLVPGSLYFPIREQDEVIVIPSDQSVAFDSAQARLSDAQEPGLSQEVQLDRQHAALGALREFRENYPGSFFAPEMLFDQGYLLWRLNRTAEALEVFELFVDRYPANVSVPGAWEHMCAIKAGVADPSKAGDVDNC